MALAVTIGVSDTQRYVCEKLNQCRLALEIAQEQVMRLNFIAIMSKVEGKSDGLIL